VVTEKSAAASTPEAAASNHEKILKNITKDKQILHNFAAEVVAEKSAAASTLEAAASNHEKMR
jgi:hypothetical protein